MPDEEPSTSPVHTPPDSEERGRKLSDILWSIAGDTARERISVGDLVVALGDRALAALMVVFALPTVLPMPPGTSGILGAPLVFLSAQLMLGRRPWLPRKVADRSMFRTDFATPLDRAGPWLADPVAWIGLANTHRWRSY
ncbi:exopolysaccharide biosynthesis protein [Mesorhizobium sp. CGMCC 1.15528]|uniref:Exopolysaccharide biosynthesis protein n=1 Tax=Mesorhizobium zhangyense TaxID=1776730 RepID=A0A7C9VGK6_9HYPH|nr:exopolysaccharide biosynthesis protein [Mesorhizobium zhangyense]NGN44949.1 exopolysaccharide biosynthesis protein [Mesorhizobium zhangyense]